MPKMSEIEAMRKQRQKDQERAMPLADEMDRFWELTRALLTKDGIGVPKELPGLWKRKLDEHWRLNLNGHPDIVEKVPGFSVYVEFDHTPAALIDTSGSTFVDIRSDEVNLPALNEALEKAVNGDQAASQAEA